MTTAFDIVESAIGKLSKEYRNVYYTSYEQYKNTFVNWMMIKGNAKTLLMFPSNHNPYFERLAFETFKGDLLNDGYVFVDKSLKCTYGLDPRGVAFVLQFDF